MGNDQPFFPRYFHWVQAFHGELGVLPHGVGDGIQSAQRGLRGILPAEKETKKHPANGGFGCPF